MQHKKWVEERLPSVPPGPIRPSETIRETTGWGDGKQVDPVLAGAVTSPAPARKFRSGSRDVERKGDGKIMWKNTY